MAKAPADCRRQALNLLARREHSRVELERKLKVRSHKDDLIKDVLDELIDEGLLASDRFTEIFVRTRAAKGQGPVRIRMELAKRGIPKCDTWLDADEYDWNALAAETRIKRFGTKLPGGFKDRARQVRFLEYRGFSHDQIANALEFGDKSD